MIQSTSTVDNIENCSELDAHRRARKELKDHKRQQKKIANRARHRLHSIRYDVNHFCKPLINDKLPSTYPIIANERCGSWFAYPFMQQQHKQRSCYFKSTDGHIGTWNFSLKRLNLNIIDIVNKCHGGCIIMDASCTKEMPDSFSRTIPIWACVLNRIVTRYRNEMNLPQHEEFWDDKLYAPDYIVSEEEKDKIMSLIDYRVDSLYQSGAIVDPEWLVRTLTKPLRPFWVTPTHNNCNNILSSNRYYNVICLNCSTMYNTKGTNVWLDEENFYYTTGAADDQESWARQLNPRLFWMYHEEILDRTSNEDETDTVIDNIVRKEIMENEAYEYKEDTSHNALYDIIGELGIYIGTRRAGRPPDCWDNFDAILNVTDTEYDGIDDCYKKSDIMNDEIIQRRNRGFYMQIPAKEGKKDRSELEKWMAVGIAFIIKHAQCQRRILIHCAQGKDRSVAIAIASVAILCNLKLPLQWKNDFFHLSLDDLCCDENFIDDTLSWFECTGLKTSLVQQLLGREGRDRFLNWIRKNLYKSQKGEYYELASKETLRLALLLIQQDREKAEPSRSTMQKLNRFFMSKTNYD